MTELKPCPKCKSYPSFQPYDNGEYEVECGCTEETQGHGACCSGDYIKHFKGFNILELMDSWNKNVDQQSKPSLPKTLEEAYNFMGYGNIPPWHTCPRLVALYADLTLLAGLYNDHWHWDGDSTYSIIMSGGGIASCVSAKCGEIKFKSREIAEEFAKHFGDMLKEFYSL